MDTPRSASELAHAVLDAMNDRDLERIRDLVTDDFVDHGAPFPHPPGPDGYLAILTFVTEVLEIRIEVHDVVEAGDLVAIRATAHGIHNVAPAGIEPTGRPYAMQTAHFYRARDGRLCEHWGVRDELDVQYQVGAMVPPVVALPQEGAA
jgi:predicted ester cyclase